MLQETEKNIIGNILKVPQQHTSKSTLLGPSIVATKGEDSDEDCRNPATHWQAASVFSDGGLSQKSTVNCGKLKDSRQLHGKINSSSASILGVSRTKLGRSWSSDDTGMTFNVKYQSKVDFDHDIISYPGVPFLPFLPAQLSTQKLISVVNSPIQLPESNSAELGWNSVSAKNRIPVVKADMVSVQPLTPSSTELESTLDMRRFGLDQS
jgi:hypothetical protein